LSFVKERGGGGEGEGERARAREFEFSLKKDMTSQFKSCSKMTLRHCKPCFKSSVESSIFTRAAKYQDTVPGDTVVIVDNALIKDNQYSNIHHEY
jgi:hypothetical protein